MDSTLQPLSLLFTNQVTRSLLSAFGHFSPRPENALLAIRSLCYSARLAILRTDADAIRESSSNRSRRSRSTMVIVSRDTRRDETTNRVATTSRFSPDFRPLFYAPAIYGFNSRAKVDRLFPWQSPWRSALNLGQGERELW